MWGIKELIAGPFDSITEANAWAAANTGALFVGLLCTVSGVQYTWMRAAGWVYSPGGAVGALYNGTTIPFPTPSAALIGMRIPVVNTAVPRGFSWLECTGTAWVPPSGELIAQYSSPTYLAQATPGIQSLYMAWQSPDIIPDYMIPDGGPFTINAAANIANASPVAGCHLMCGISGSDPTSAEASDYMLGIRLFTPTAGGYGFLPTISGFAIRSGTGYRRQNWQGNATQIAYQGSDQAKVVTGSLSACQFVSGANRIYVKAVTKSASDVVTVNMVQIKAGF